MRAAELLAALRPSLARRGLGEVELFLKKGRSRRLEIGVSGAVASVRHEQGWGLRAGGERCSLFVCGSGSPEPEGPWPEPDGQPLRLPAPGLIPHWTPPQDLTAPLASEGEGRALLEAVARRLQQELPGARLLTAFVEEGASQVEIASSRGVAVSYPTRAAALYLDARGAGPSRAVLHLASREVRSFHPNHLARRLADQLVVSSGKPPGDRDRGETLLAPPVALRLLAALLPLLVGPGAASRAAARADRRGRIASPRVTLIDNGRLSGGVQEAPVDGEGVPTGEVVLVEEGIYRQPLLSWAEAQPPASRPSGCCRRASWRDLPRPGATHLYLRPDPKVAVASLVGMITRGYYLLDVTGPGWFDFERDRFALPVCGFALRAGRATEPLSGVRLEGGLSSLLQRVEAVARDLTFLPLGGMLGCPTLLVSGLEISPHRPGGSASG